jgi:alkanesulfonate monooxygenase SsuD/methylene tetrahydromethanopterin reductase-like flavin-dependent oxidoreductase (luciferase family)
VLFGAFAPPALERVARWGDGLLSATPPEFTEQLFRAVEKSWDTHGRTGRPRLVSQVNVAIGPDATLTDARTNIVSYYSFLGDHVERMAEGLVVAFRSSSGVIMPRVEVR